MESRLDAQNTTVVDVTYFCNATCRYCQWGNRNTPGRAHQELEKILLPRTTLESLGTERIVLSGGEPRTRPDIESILRYYKTLVQDVIVITNGYGLDEAEVQRLTSAGATGIAVSLDSVFPDEATKTRMTPPKLHSQIVSNLEKIAASPRRFELGINSVVSHPTANWRNVRALLEFGRRIGVQFIKFQPIFDDGYVGSNAPELRLGRDDAESLAEIAGSIETVERPVTNPQSFWIDLVRLLQGGHLDPSACGLGTRHSMVTGTNLGICYWLDSSHFGNSGESVSEGRAKDARTSFESEKLRCKVGFQCFCTQNISHTWTGGPDKRSI